MIPLLVAIAVQSADTGAALYQSWCAACHGRDGRGTPSAGVRTAVPPADLADCAASTPEPEARWIGTVARGGAAYGLSLDMPAFGAAVSVEQIRWVVRYIRSLCGSPSWPPGELNFPRGFLVEKAFPENEVVVVDRDRSQEYIYERRLGPRLQFELAGRTAFDGERNNFDGVGVAGKYDVWHSPSARAITSVGVEALPPLGRQAHWEVEPFAAFGWSPGGAVNFQGQVVATWEEAAGVAGAEYRLGVGKVVGRVAPMVEAGWVLPRQGEQALSFYPQLWVQLSRLGHVAGSLGADLPAVGPEPRRPRLIAFLLWDFGDAGLLRGW